MIKLIVIGSVLFSAHYILSHHVPGTNAVAFHLFGYAITWMFLVFVGLTWFIWDRVK